MLLNEAIQGCVSNNRIAQEWMYRQYFPVLLPMCKRFASDEDKVITYMNDGFMKIFKNIKSLNDEEKIVPWMKRIVYHAICDNLRRDKNTVRLIELGDNDQKQTPDALNQLYEEDIIALIDRLPTATADVFVLYAIHGYTHKEIGTLKNISEGTSKWHYSEARKKLKILLKQQLKKSVHVL